MRPGYRANGGAQVGFCRLCHSRALELLTWYPASQGSDGGGGDVSYKPHCLPEGTSGACISSNPFFGKLSTPVGSRKA